MKEYERVVGGRAALVSPPRDGAAWALGIICFWGAEHTVARIVHTKNFRLRPLWIKPRPFFCMIEVAITV